ncbi:MAG: hypothetical protein GVY16_06565 [Planctomycetes bacterium]|jgi:hypothetical protein|nr:hypothetical protein [Planctomycetota bacterium]
MSRTPIKLYLYDLNWAHETLPHSREPIVRASAAHEWTDLDPQEFFDVHMAMGNNAMLCHSYCHADYALYPSRLGVDVDSGGRLHRLGETQGITHTQNVSRVMARTGHALFTRCSRCHTALKGSWRASVGLLRLGEPPESSRM